MYLRAPGFDKTISFSPRGNCIFYLYRRWFKIQDTGSCENLAPLIDALRRCFQAAALIMLKSIRAFTAAKKPPPPEEDDEEYEEDWYLAVWGVSEAAVEKARLARLSRLSEEESNGTRTLADGIVYTGALNARGVPEGRGKVVSSEPKAVYEGDFKYGRKHGHGVERNRVTVYDGAWRLDQKHGRGSERVLADGTRYEGDFKYGVREGSGKLLLADGSIMYEGEWNDDEMHGWGTVLNSDGSVIYEGEWFRGLKEGRGTARYPDGTVRHDGEWKDDKPVMHT